MQVGRRKPKNYGMKQEPLKRKRRRPLPNGGVRATTIRPKRNFVTVDFGEDLWGIKRKLEEKSQRESRTVSAIVRDILKHTLIDWS